MPTLQEIIYDIESQDKLTQLINGINLLSEKIKKFKEELDLLNENYDDLPEETQEEIKAKFIAIMKESNRLQGLADGIETDDMAGKFEIMGKHFGKNICSNPTCENYQDKDAGDICLKCGSPVGSPTDIKRDAILRYRELRKELNRLAKKMGDI